MRERCEEVVTDHRVERAGFFSEWSRGARAGACKHVRNGDQLKSTLRDARSHVKTMFAYVSISDEIFSVHVESSAAWCSSSTRDG